MTSFFRCFGHDILDGEIMRKFGHLYAIGQMNQQGRLAEKQDLWDTHERKG